jgi:hypothetical protein
MLWTNRKRVLARMVGLGYNVFQTDLDVIWATNPYPILKTIHSHHQLVLQVLIEVFVT